MPLLTFKGGIHPEEGKEISKHKAIVKYKPSGDIVLPVSQHIGAPATPVVNVGDRVLRGQLIASANGFVSANIHSSVSGIVKAIEPRKTFTGAMVESIIIENDQEYEEVPVTDFRKPEEMTAEEKIELIKNAGVVGMGGACFPTHVKLSPKNPEKIEYVIVNGSECEPYLTSDYRRMVENPELVIEGLRIMLSLFPNAKGIIAIEDNKHDVVYKFHKLLKKDPLISVKELYTKYPQGGERQLIYALTKKKVNSSMLPADVGCIVDNVDTVVAIYDAVVNKKPLTNRIVTVTGDNVYSPYNYNVPIGTLYIDLIQESGSFINEPKKVISGGPMMGFAMEDCYVPIQKGSSAILAMSKDDATCEETECINCGKCVSACPERLLPTLLAKAASNHETNKFVKLNGLECIECGCCTYICPAKKNLAQTIKTKKKEVIASRRKK